VEVDELMQQHIKTFNLAYNAEDRDSKPFARPQRKFAVNTRQNDNKKKTMGQSDRASSLRVGNNTPGTCLGYLACV
jgi:hypothetical protein